jgi:hypothetical protein
MKLRIVEKAFVIAGSSSESIMRIVLEAHGGSNDIGGKHAFL